jgi:hypothetical protein
VPHLPLLDEGADFVGGHVHAVKVGKAALSGNILHRKQGKPSLTNLSQNINIEIFPQNHTKYAHNGWQRQSKPERKEGKR